MSTKIGLAISTVLLVGAAGAAVSSIFNTSPKVTSTVVERASVSSVTGKLENSLNLDVKNISATPNDAVLLDTEVGYESVNYVIQRLEEIGGDGKEVHLLIDSPGGSVVDGAKLIAYMESTKTKVNTVCVGLCASMAAHIHQAGKKRLIQDKAILMFHPASGGARGTMNEMISMLNMLNTYVDRMDANAAKRSGIEYNDFKLRVLKNFWVEGQDAVSQHLADGMVFINLTKGSVNEMSVTQKLGVVKNEKTTSNTDLIHDIK